jgi:hypothetical protein
MLNHFFLLQVKNKPYKHVENMHLFSSIVLFRTTTITRKKYSVKLEATIDLSKFKYKEEEVLNYTNIFGSKRCNNSRIISQSQPKFLKCLN